MLTHCGSNKFVFCGCARAGERGDGPLVTPELLFQPKSNHWRSYLRSPRPSQGVLFLFVECDFFRSSRDSGPEFGQPSTNCGLTACLMTPPVGLFNNKFLLCFDIRLTESDSNIYSALGALVPGTGAVRP
ncbi:hypothetical protein EVAR_50583_1 [Eumeta japonica]|uniref:Uncharacterized protein n=1 Tax=Eumeta variegata TaxID=151549 RepID=A0A4C1Y881_EUMVA|nr:hypothetical protein EVAR_50583_1 [Eumeta japonica]